jgi:hypothetical protein
MSSRIADLTDSLKCLIFGLIMSYLGWNGKDEPDPAHMLLAAFDNMKSMKAY